MNIANYVESLYRQHTEELVNCAAFQALVDGRATRADYDAFIRGVYRTHQNSPQFLAFIYALCPPKAQERVAHNLLEEMGLEEEEGESHPELLLALISGAGLQAEIESLKVSAQETLRESVCQPLLFGSLREVGLSVMTEVFSFEHMLAHTSSQIADFLAAHRDLSEATLIWFRHHSEVDIEHAEEALLTIQDYVDYYEFDEAEARDVIDLAMRENVYIKRYLSTEALADARDMR